MILVEPIEMYEAEEGESYAAIWEHEGQPWCETWRNDADGWPTCYNEHTQTWEGVVFADDKFPANTAYFRIAMYNFEELH